MCPRIPPHFRTLRRGRPRTNANEFETEALLARQFVQFAGSFSDLDRVTLHLVIQCGTLDAEKLSRLLLVSVAFCKRLENRVPLDVVETLHPSSSGSRRTTLYLLEHCRQLNLGRQLFYADQALA